MNENKILKTQSSLLFFCRLFFFALFSPPVFAAVETFPWMTYLFIIMFISLVIGVFLSWRNPRTESFTGRFLLAGLYFWILTFAQCIIFALLLYLNIIKI